MTASETHRAIEATFRIERARLIAGLARMVRSVDRAEELAQDALVVALSEWPRTGVPDNPGAWLMLTAKHRAIDVLRRGKRIDRKHEELGEAMTDRERTTPDLAAVVEDDIGDDMLRLVFADLVDWYDTRMIEICCGLGFELETLDFFFACKVSRSN